MPPCNKAGISNFCIEFQKLQKFQIAEIPVKTALLLQFLFDHSEILLEKLGIWCDPITKPEFQISNYPECPTMGQRVVKQDFAGKY